MDRSAFFAQLWDDYTTLAPQAAPIHALFTQRYGAVTNDHVAFRTWADCPLDIAHLEPHLFALGYRRNFPYDFPDKKLNAWSYSADDPDAPLVFLSELRWRELSGANTDLIERRLNALPARLPHDASVFYFGRLWSTPTWDEFNALAAESEYAGWLAVHGFHANHFTVSVNRLAGSPSLADVVALLQAEGFALNGSGGVIKGTSADLLVQASTLADTVPVTFADGEVHRVPGCYYEFAQRFTDAQGHEYRGFVAANANRIFESTDRQPKT